MRARLRSGAWWGLVVFAIADLASPFVPLGGILLLVAALVAPVGQWLVRRLEVLR